MIPTHYWQISDDQLLKQCRFEAFRGPGPGGQKRNKTSSAVRLVHLPTGTSTIAGESRSQHRNHAAALVRLRHQLVLDSRNPVEPVPGWFIDRPATTRLRLTEKSEFYLPAMSLVLDWLAHSGWSVSDAAAALGITTGHLVGFLRADEKLWTRVNRQRIAAGLRPLVGQA